MQGRVQEIAVEIVRADGSRLPALVNSVLKTDADGEPQLVRTTIFDATDRQRYERELLAARDRERAARARTEALQRVTAALAAATDTDAVARALARELEQALGVREAGFATGEPPAADAATPVAGADRQHGTLWLRFARPRQPTADEQAFLRACADHALLALDRVALYERDRTVAHVLQRSLLTEPAADPRYEIAVGYHPAVEDLEVGGDWHDAFALPGGRVGIVVGDVVGRGIGAASAMGQLRSAVRALAGAGMEPGALLGHLDWFVEQVPAARYATLAFLDVDPGTGTVRSASAGHLPALLLGDPPAFTMGGRSSPLGVPPEDERPHERFALPPGGGFLLCTDGLVERRGEAIDVGLERLRSEVAARPGLGPAALVGALPDALLPAGPNDDDVCLLAFRLRP